MPKIGVGIFRLGKNIDFYIQKMSYEYYSKGEEFISDLYTFYNESLEVFVDQNGLIEDINCSHFCYYKGKNLIGYNFDKFLIEENYQGSLQKEKIYLMVEEKGQTQTVYDLDDLGLQIWVYRKKIVTVIVWNPNDYEE